VANTSPFCCSQDGQEPAQQQIWCTFVSCQPDLVAATFLDCICESKITVTWVFCCVNFSRYGGKGNFAMYTGVAVCLADCWLKGIVHAWGGLVTVGRPYLLRLDRRHNQAESDHKWYASIINREPFVMIKSA
jgi:hypothetical protein